MKKAILLVGHGSKQPGANDAIDRVIVSLRQEDPHTIFYSAYLEIQTPSIPDGIKRCLDEGAAQVVVVAYFVQSGKHVVQDIPRIVLETKNRYPDKDIRLANYLGFDERLAGLVKDRAREAQ